MSEERVAIITGAASGIGRAAVELFTERGTKVVAVDLSADGLSWAAGRDDAILKLRASGNGALSGNQIAPLVWR